MSDFLRLYPEHKRPGCVYFDTFTFQGEEYYLNTIVNLNRNLSTNITKVQVVEAGLDNGVPFWTYAMWNHLGGVSYRITQRSPDVEIKSIIKSSNTPPKVNEPEYYKDSEVPVVAVGWIIYAIVMIGSIIFKDFISLWVISTIFFFYWRRNQLKKPSKHDYG